MKRLIAELERWKAGVEGELLAPWQLVERAQETLSSAFPDHAPIEARVLYALIRDVQGNATKEAQRNCARDLIALIKSRYTDAVQPLLYQLLRDHLPAGVVEKLVSDACVHLGKDTRYSNEHLGAYAAELRDRLLGDKP